MRTWVSAVLLLVLSVLGVATFIAALDVAESSLERALCRRNGFTDPQRPLPRIGQPCPY